MSEPDERGEFEPTEGETRLVGVLVPAISIGSVAAVVFGNTTGNWLPGFALAIGSLAAAVAMTIRSARTRGQSIIATISQIARRKPPPH